MDDTPTYSKVSISVLVSNFFGGFQSQYKKYVNRKKSRFQFQKICSPKKSWYRFWSKFWYRHLILDDQGGISGPGRSGDAGDAGLRGGPCSKDDQP